MYRYKTALHEADMRRISCGDHRPLIASEDVCMMMMCMCLYLLQDALVPVLIALGELKYELCSVTH